MSNDMKKAKTYFKPIIPHINLIHDEIDNLHQEIFDNKKKCFVIRASIQESMNRLKEESNGIIKQLVEDISSIRDSYMSDMKGYGAFMLDISKDLNKNKEETKKIQKDLHNCERKINYCENEIGYHLIISPLPDQITAEKDKYRTNLPNAENKSQQRAEKESTPSNGNEEREEQQGEEEDELVMEV